MAPGTDGTSRPFPLANQSSTTAAVQLWSREPSGSPVNGSRYSGNRPPESASRAAARRRSARARSPRFTVALPPNNRLGVEPGVAALVSDGYWLLLPPLPPGRHVLRLGVSLREPEGAGGVTYRLTVAEPRVADL